MRNKNKYYVYSEGYAMSNRYEGCTVYFGKVTMEEQYWFTSEFDGKSYSDWETEDAESEYIADKWGGDAITGIYEAEDNGWSYPEFSNGLIHIYDGPSREEAEKAYNEYIHGKVEFTELERW